MDEFARNIYPDYDPSDGFGYYELLLSTSSEEFGEIESSSDVIVLNKVNHPCLYLCIVCLQVTTVFPEC